MPEKRQNTTNYSQVTPLALSIDFTGDVEYIHPQKVWSRPDLETNCCSPANLETNPSSREDEMPPG